MSHSTINIIEEPDINCPQPAYNCVKYCFEATDFLVSTGTKAVFTIELDPILSGYNPGGVFIIAGQPFTTGTTNTYNEIDTSPPQTQTEFANNCKAALEKNNFIYTNFEIKVSGTVMTATARNVGEISPFTFDYSAVGTPPINSDTQGTPNVYRDNYRLVTEIWQKVFDISLGDYLDVLINKEAYIPNAAGELCINIGEKIAALLETTFLHDANLAVSCYKDITIAQRFFVRYGEAYSDDLDECNVQLREFVNSDVITVFNGAFQRGESTDKITLVCEHQFMTNAPDYTCVTRNSEQILWIYLKDILPQPPSTITIRPKFILTYTDGTTDTGTGAQCLWSADNFPVFIAIPCGGVQLGFFANPAKTIDFYEVRIEQTDSLGPVVTDYASQIFKVIPSCGAEVEFYFLNEFGGYDTILFTQVSNISLEQQYSIFEEFLDCDDTNAIRAAKGVIDQSASDVFTVTSKFTNDYLTRRWLREFLVSPIKVIKTAIQTDENETFSKVLFVDPSQQYFSKDDNFLYLTLQFGMNEDINTQKN